jgi:hypothetical protein
VPAAGAFRWDGRHLTTFILCLVALVLLVGLRIRALYRFRTLRWSPRLGFYSFRGNVMRYLRRCDWEVEKRTPWAPMSFFAQKNKRKCAFICLPADISVTSSRIKDFAGLPKSATGSKQVIVVTLEEVPDHFIEEAARGGVKLIWYKNLASL